MRPVPAFALAVAVATALAGCGSAGQPGLEAYVPSDGELDGLHLPAVDGAQKAYFDSYGMSSNPGSADANQFFSTNGTTATKAHGAIYVLDGGQQDDLVFVFALRFASADAAQDYLGQVRCNAQRQMLEDGRIVVQVAWSASGGREPLVMAAAQDAIAEVESAGASKAC